MVKSMTGFGRSIFHGESRSFEVEIKTVNYKYLDINIRMPKNLMSLEQNIRSLISKNIKRGKMDISITQNITEKQNVNVVLDKKLADSYVKCLNTIKDSYDVKDDISVSLIAKFNDVINLEYKEEDLEKIWSELNTCISEAIKLLIEMRIKEGEKLKSDISLKCSSIKGIVENIEKRAPKVVIDYKEKLNLRLKELLNEKVVDENRIAMEVAIFADRACIDEEIVRLKSHINQMYDTLELNEPIGRKLDFLVQEMNRETNTIGSKANDLEISNLVIELKSQIEKIREQIQNVE